jgi:hypothetical protein
MWITIRGANHFGFNHDGALFKSPLLRTTFRTVGILPFDGRHQIEVTADCISTFFDVYLKEGPATELNATSEYSEIEYLH